MSNKFRAHTFDLSFQLNNRFNNHFNRDWNLNGYEGRLHDSFNNLKTIYWMKSLRRSREPGEEKHDYMIMGVDVPYTDIPKFNTVFPFIKRKRSL